MRIEQFMGYLCEIYAENEQALRLYITTKEESAGWLQGIVELKEFCSTIFMAINGNKDFNNAISTKIEEIKLQPEELRRFESVFSFELLCSGTDEIECPIAGIIIYATVCCGPANYRDLCKKLIYEIPVIFVNTIIGVGLVAGRYHSNLSQDDLDNILVELTNEYNNEKTPEQRKPLLAPCNADADECVVAMILNNVKHTMNIMLNMSNELDRQGQISIDTLTVIELEKFLASLVSAGHMIQKSIDELNKLESDEEIFN